MIDLPNVFLDKMRDLLIDDFGSFLRSYDRAVYPSFSLNTLKINIEDFNKLTGNHFKKVNWSDNGYYYDDEKLTKNILYKAGLYYIQEASAMAPANILEIEKGDLVLDACAAPGGKSFTLASKLKGEGLLVSNDISSSRAKALLRNLELAGIRNYYVISEDLNKLALRFKNSFDKILLDAPCSGEGMFHKDPSLIKSYLEKGNDYYHNLQLNLIDSAYQMLKKGGKMLYSTCTFDPKENEEIIASLLTKYHDIKVIKLNNKEFINGELGSRLYPHLLKGEGHFVCLLEKEGHKISDNNPKVKSYTHPLLSDFLKHTTFNFKDGYFINLKDQLYFIPNHPLDFRGIRVLRSGLWLGELKKHEFVPSQAFAMALRSNEFDNVLKLELDDALVLRYLKGESFHYNIKDGYVLVCIKDYPIGFGKAKDNYIKNKRAIGWL